MTIILVFLCRDEEDEDPIKKAEDDFWYTLNQEKKELDTRERKRQDALMPKHQPTPIPEESSEQTLAEGKVRDLVINCATCKLLM